MKSKVGDIYVPSRLERRPRGPDGELGPGRLSEGGGPLGRETFDDEKRRVDLRVEILPQEKITIVVNGANVPGRLLGPDLGGARVRAVGPGRGRGPGPQPCPSAGLLFATVKSRVEKDRNEIRIIHDVTPGEKFRIAGVDFRGNTAFSSLDLKNRLAVIKGVPFFSFLSYDRLFTIPREVESFYRENGFADIQVRLDFAREKAGVRAIFDVREGPKTTVDAIRIEGAVSRPRGGPRPRPRQPGGRTLLRAQRPKGRRPDRNVLPQPRRPRQRGRRPRRALRPTTGSPSSMRSPKAARSPSGTSSSRGTGFDPESRHPQGAPGQEGRAEPIIRSGPGDQAAAGAPGHFLRGPRRRDPDRTR